MSHRTSIPNWWVEWVANPRGGLDEKRAYELTLFVIQLGKNLTFARAKIRELIKSNDHSSRTVH